MEGEKGYQKRFWTAEEDEILADYIRVNGKGRWNRLAKMTGLKRCGKSCRLRWINYLSPSIKRGDFSEEEDDLIIRLHNLLGNRWSLIAGRVPGRTDNQIKNYWNTHLAKKFQVINKEKGKSKTGSSSQMESGKVVGNESFVHKNTSLEQISQYCVRAEEEKIVENDSENQFGFFQVEEGMANEGYESPFWFSNHDLELINSSSLLELLEPCSLDFFWQGGCELTSF